VSGGKVTVRDTRPCWSAVTSASTTGRCAARFVRLLRLIAASSEQARLLELFQLQYDEGPCLEAFATGHAVVETDLRSALERWPRFTPYAVGAGYDSVYAMPLRLRQAAAATKAQLRDEQLQYALDSRIIIEQAKGMVAEHAHIDMATAFERIRTRARSTNTKLTGLAAHIVEGQLDLDTLTVAATRKH